MMQNFAMKGWVGLQQANTHTGTDDWVRGICLRAIPSNVEVTRDAAPWYQNCLLYTFII